MGFIIEDCNILSLDIKAVFLFFLFDSRSVTHPAHTLAKTVVCLSGFEDRVIPQFFVINDIILL